MRGQGPVRGLAVAAVMVILAGGSAMHSLAADPQTPPLAEAVDDWADALDTARRATAPQGGTVAAQTLDDLGDLATAAQDRAQQAESALATVLDHERRYDEVRTRRDALRHETGLVQHTSPSVLRAFNREPEALPPFRDPVDNARAARLMDTLSAQTEERMQSLDGALDDLAALSDDAAHHHDTLAQSRARLGEHHDALVQSLATQATLLAYLETAAPQTLPDTALTAFDTARARLDAVAAAGALPRTQSRLAAIAGAAADIADHGAFATQPDETIAAPPGPITPTPGTDSAALPDQAAGRDQAFDTPIYPMPGMARVAVPIRSVPLVDGVLLPVSGEIVTGFEDTDPASQRSSQGLTMEARPQERLIAPMDGTIAYAGEFRGYDRILIIEHSGGYHSLISGVGRIDVEVGQPVLAGEPLGAMPSPQNGQTGAATLYFEFREDGRPVAPVDGLKRAQKRGRG